MSYSFASSSKDQDKRLNEKDVLEILIDGIGKNDSTRIKRLAQRLRRQTKTGPKLKKQNLKKRSFLTVDEVDEVFDFLSPNSRQTLIDLYDSKKIKKGQLYRKLIQLTQRETRDPQPLYTPTHDALQTLFLSEESLSPVQKAEKRDLLNVLLAFIDGHKDLDLYFEQEFFAPLSGEPPQTEEEKNRQINYDEIRKFYIKVKNQNYRKKGFITFRRYFFRAVVEHFPRQKMSWLTDDNNNDDDDDTLSIRDVRIAPQYVNWLDFLYNFLLSEEETDIQKNSIKNFFVYPTFPKIKTLYEFQFLSQEFLTLMKHYTGDDFIQLFNKGCDILLSMRKKKFFPNYKRDTDRFMFRVRQYDWKVNECIRRALEIIPGLPPYKLSYKKFPYEAWSLKFSDDIFKMGLLLFSSINDSLSLKTVKRPQPFSVSIIDDSDSDDSDSDDSDDDDDDDDVVDDDDPDDNPRGAFNFVTRRYDEDYDYDYDYYSDNDHFQWEVTTPTVYDRSWVDVIKRDNTALGRNMPIRTTNPVDYRPLNISFFWVINTLRLFTHGSRPRFWERRSYIPKSYKWTKDRKKEIKKGIGEVKVGYKSLMDLWNESLKLLEMVNAFLIKSGGWSKKQNLSELIKKNRDVANRRFRNAQENQKQIEVNS